MYLNVPFGHGFGTKVPAEQKKPEGQRNPPGLSNGAGSDAPPTQTNPAAHVPLGNVCPSHKKKIKTNLNNPYKCVFSLRENRIKEN